MSFTDKQIKMLEEKLSSEHVSARKQGGIQLSYLEGYHVIDEANRIFGFDGWSYKLDDIKVIAEEEVEIGRNNEDGLHVGVIATVTVEVAGVSRQDVGYGSSRGKSMVDVYELAHKEAVTDALKRALRSFGNQFGNALYDKEQKNVESANDKAKRTKKSSTKKKASSSTSKKKSSTTKKSTKSKKTKESVVDFIALIDDLESEEEFAQFREEYGKDIKASEDHKEIIKHFNEKRKEVA